MLPLRHSEVHHFWFFFLAVAQMCVCVYACVSCWVRLFAWEKHVVRHSAEIMVQFNSRLYTIFDLDCRRPAYAVIIIRCCCWHCASGYGNSQWLFTNMSLCRVTPNRPFFSNVSASTQIKLVPLCWLCPMLLIIIQHIFRNAYNVNPQSVETLVRCMCGDNLKGESLSAAEAALYFRIYSTEDFERKLTWLIAMNA